jgi:hypothetical protein
VEQQRPGEPTTTTICTRRRRTRRGDDDIRREGKTDQKGIGSEEVEEE